MMELVLPSSFIAEMGSLTLNLTLYISKSIKQLQVCSPVPKINNIQAYVITIDAYEQAGIQKFRCIFLFVTKR